jgi:hypothetical protein
LDQPVTQVAAITDGQTAEQPLEDTAALALRFQNDIIGTVCCGRFAPDRIRRSFQMPPGGDLYRQESMPGFDPGSQGCILIINCFFE